VFTLDEEVTGEVRRVTYGAAVEADPLEASRVPARPGRREQRLRGSAWSVRP
jgi:hypothetical protein